MRLPISIMGLLLIICIGHSCFRPKPKNEIVFSCIHCKGCVLKQAKFIKQHSLDEVYQLTLDTSCIDKKLLQLNLKYTHQSQQAIFGKYGEFGNMLFFDSTGHRVAFLNNMNLHDYIVTE